ncbi:vacuolar protein sorting-associated protein 54 [Schistocerca piceifrons]|uniref:vacuolar protein sorting-associated protein 54 n=1 Tax=Schistocerca piceifrons TaxID=274613 RepID=UPI001F5EB0E3|nr:vacuolar protein sorting-associated protein 54 [Schistocerca piceifrons]
MPKTILVPENKHVWSKCTYCKNLEFKAQQDFTRHLREHHCTKEGGSFVCHYGLNGVCPSLPVEGVSDQDYEEHVLRHHVQQPRSARHQAMLGRHSKLLLLQQQQQNAEHSQPWTVYSASQNLPAVLNDPSRGKQRDFFTKTWGDGFVEKSDIPVPHYIPDIGPQHFESYLRKIARRYRKHARINSIASKPNSHAELLQHFPNLRAKSSIEKIQLDVSGIPKIFLQPNFDLTVEETFNSVFPFTKEQATFGSDGENTKNSYNSGKLIQEKLSHYLDTVEVQIAHQVAHKSEAFFHAMTSHDALSEQMSQTINDVRALREKIQHIDKSVVKDSLQILRLERLRCNHASVVSKLQLMATVHQTQPTIQLLLSTPDYVAALELIATTQEILVKELAGIHSFRHLGSQLLEMERLIDKMLSTEFERYATADLNRPLNDKQQILEGDKLVSIIFGMLRQKHLNFIDTYKEEAFTTIKAVVKQIVIEEVAASDSTDNEVALTGVGDQLQGLAISDWLHLLRRTTGTLLQLLTRVKAVHDVMQQAADVSAGKMPAAISSTGSAEDIPTEIHVGVGSDPGESLLAADEHQRVSNKLHDLMTSVCDYAHERVAQLVQAQDRVLERQSSCWLADKATASEVCELSRVIDKFAVACEKICGRSSTALRSAFKIQASKFIQRFHQDRKTKLSLILDNERWKQADVPAEFQDLVDQIATYGHFSPPKKDDGDGSVRKPEAFLIYGEQKFAVVGTALLLIKMVAEYCECAEELPVTVALMCRNLAELLKLFNSRCCQLVLGAGALHSAGLKTITSTNLALASRALQLLLALLPAVRVHFDDLLQQQQQQQHQQQQLTQHVMPFRGAATGVGVLDTVEKDVLSHVQEIEEKVLSIVGNLITAQLGQWEVRPPVPSQPFRNISRHLTKLHEAVATVLPEAQVQYIYRTVNSLFKSRLREQLMKLNVVNNGGPQHGIVTSELTFYLETLKTLKVLPVEELSDGAMKSIWDPQ